MDQSESLLLSPVRRMKVKRRMRIKMLLKKKKMMMIKRLVTREIVEKKENRLWSLQ